jgi:predicted RNA-binding protein with PUA-like domain
MAKQFWLMKSEPSVYSIDDMERDGVTSWEGVRNYSARNNMRAMKVGDEALLYHSATNPPGVAGLVRVVKGAYPDHHAFDPNHQYFDPKSSPEEPRWDMVDVEFVERFPRIVTLHEIKANPAFDDMVLVKRGRLSVQPVRREEFDRIVRMGREG